jgi:PKD repeat protein
MSINLNVALPTSCFKVKNLRQNRAVTIVALLLLMMIIGFCIQISSSQAANQAVFQVVPATQTVAVGEVFNVTIEVDLPSPGAGGIQVVLGWNPTVLTGINLTEVLFHNVTPPSEWDNIWTLGNSINNTGGTASYAYLFQSTTRATGYSPPYAPILGNYTLAVVTLEGKSPGFSSLTFQVLKVGDIAGKAVPATGVGGTVKVGTPAPQVTMISPGNTTYGTSTVNLNFTLAEPAVWVGYSLDGNANVTITGSTNISASEGQHRIVIYANDSAGRTGASNKVYFTVDTSPPVASFTYSPSPPVASYVFENFRWDLAFNASASHGVLSNITAYFWDFGDGTNETGIAVTHVYRQPGTYSVKLNVTNSVGNSAAQVEAVTLNPGSEPLSIPWLLVAGIVIPVVWVPVLLFYFMRTRRKTKKT